MIKISAAILESSKEDFLKQLLRLLNAGIRSIDVDIAEVNFTGHRTVSFVDIAEYFSEYPSLDWGFHLMLTNPRTTANAIWQYCDKLSLAYPRIYVHQETDLGPLPAIAAKNNYELAVSVNVKTELLDLDYYNQFNEVQIMTVELGVQGGAFYEEALHKVTQLRELGYMGLVSIDGAVDLAKAKLIGGKELDRVSVGSYLIKSDDITKSYADLYAALN